MAEQEVPPLVLGEGSSKLARVSPGVIRGHVLLMGSPRPAAATVADLIGWAAKVRAGVLAIDLTGDLAALMVERADRGGSGDFDLRIVTPSSPVGIPLVFKPLSGLSSATTSPGWKRLRGWLPQLLATLAGRGPGTPDHDATSTHLLRLLDDVKAANPNLLTVQSLIQAVKEALARGDLPLDEGSATMLEAELGGMGEDLRNAALAYGAPADLPRLLETPVAEAGAQVPAGRRHVDVVLVDHMTSVADRNSLITALLLEVFAWCRLRGQKERLLLVVPEVESPTAFIQTRAFAQRLTKHVLETSEGTGLLAVSVPARLDDPSGLPRFGGILLEKAMMDRSTKAVEEVLMAQGMSPSSFARMGMLAPNEWALAAGSEWTKWHRFTPDPAASQERELDLGAVDRLLPAGVRNVFRYSPGPEEGEGADDGAGGGRDAEAPAAKARSETDRAARAVEDAEDLLDYTTTKRPKATDSQLRREVQELLKRKLEEKERAREAQKFELSEIDLVDGEEPTDLEVAARSRRPLSGGVIDDDRGRMAEPAAKMTLHADDLQVELAVLEAREAEEGRRRREAGEEPVVVDLDRPVGDWESVSPEIALGADDAPRPKGRRELLDGDEGEEEEEEIIVEVAEDGR